MYNCIYVWNLDVFVCLFFVVFNLNVYFKIIVSNYQIIIYLFFTKQYREDNNKCHIRQLNFVKFNRTIFVILLFRSYEILSLK